MLKKILIPKVYMPIIYLLLAYIIFRILCIIVDKALVINKKNKHRSELAIKRQTTIVNLIKNIIKYIVAIFTILAILNVYEIETTSIIASLGIDDLNNSSPEAKAKLLVVFFLLFDSFISSLLKKDSGKSALFSYCCNSSNSTIL